MNSAYHFVSAPEYVAVDVEKGILFSEREKERSWTERELYNAEADTLIFLQYGETVLEQINHGIKLEQSMFFLEC